MKIWPLGLAGAALIVKATVLARLGDHPLLQPQGDLDTTKYVELARQIAAGGPLAVREAFFVSPLYVYFLAVVFSIRDSLLAARNVQILLGTGAVVLVYSTARQWFDERVARVAGVLALLTGLFTFSEILILQAALDPFLVALALYLVARTQTTDARMPLVAAGIALGLLALNRPNALAYGLAAVVLIGLAAYRRGARPDRGGPAGAAHAAGRAAFVLVPLIAVLAVNAARNYQASGEAILISSHGGLNFYIGNNAGADGIYHPVPGIAPSMAGQVRDATRVAEAAEGRPLSASDVSAYFYAQAWNWIAGHPGDALSLFARKIEALVNRVDVPLNYSYAFYRRDESTLLRFLLVGPWLLLPLGLVGLVLGASAARARAGADRSSLAYWTWASFVPVYGLSVAAFFVSDRYRMPLLVPLSILSACTLVWLLDQVRARRFVPLAIAVASVAVIGIVVSRDLGLDDGLGGERARKAEWLIERGAYGEARDYVAGAAGGLRYPGVFHFRVGESLTRAGRYPDAIEQLRAALAIDRGQPAIHLALGQALLLDGRADEAVPHLRSALDRAYRPEVAGAWLVRALAAAGRRDEALSTLAGLSDAIVAGVGPATAAELGSLALELRAPASAERWLRAAVRRAPSSAEAQENLAVALLLSGRAGEALAPIQRACQLDPSSASARLNLAVVYAQLGRFDEARAAAREALRLDPSEPRAAALLKALAR